MPWLLLRPAINKSVAAALMALGMILAAAGCSTKVTRMDAQTVKDLSGDWNDTDSQQVSAEMIQDVLHNPWLADFIRTKNREPTVIVGEVQNLSHEHISVNTFIADIERTLMDSDKVQFVASSHERNEVRRERMDQDLNASESTRKAMGQEKGADFMLKGTINSIYDTSGRNQVHYYQVDFTLISMTDNSIVWAGQKKIKKLVAHSLFSL